jgi:hypothetical protein
MKGQKEGSPLSKGGLDHHRIKKEIAMLRGHHLRQSSRLNQTNLTKVYISKEKNSQGSKHSMS